MNFYRSWWISPTGYKFKEYWQLLWEIWENHKVTVCEIRASSQYSVKLHSFDTTGLWLLFEIRHTSLYLSMSHRYMCMHTHTDTGLWPSSNSLMSIYCQTKVFVAADGIGCQGGHWKLRGQSEGWQWSGVLPTFSMHTEKFQGFPAHFCLKLALYWRCHTWLALSWHIFHRKHSWTWSKGFVLPSEIPAESVDLWEQFQGLNQSQHWHSYSFWWQSTCRPHGWEKLLK